MTRLSPFLVVVDASVLIEWILPDEAPCPGTLRLIHDVRAERVALLAPILMQSEFINTLSVSVMRGRLSPDNVAQCWEAVSDLNIIYSEADTAKVASLSVRARISAYDASYVALAERHRCSLFTADRRLVNAVRSLSKRVNLISEYSGAPEYA